MHFFPRLYLLLIITLFLIIQGIILYFLGQPAFCECGYIKLWEGNISSSGNSQHIFDWYTFSHIIHGFIFYLFLRFVFPTMSPIKRLLIATGIEIGWEVVENTPLVINAYRQQALAQGYIGDSIINSLFDTIATVGGFLIAWKQRVWITLTLAIIFEIAVLYIIRDNLSLNVLNFIHQFEFISRWQSGL